MRAMNRRSVRELLTASGVEAFSEGSRLTEVQTPLLLIWGKDEKLFPAKNLEWFKARLPAHAEIDEPAGVGHCPHLDSASWLRERLHKFFGLHTGKLV